MTETSPTRGASRTAGRDLTARAVALDVLAAVLDQRRPLEDTLAAHPGFAKLAGRDRAFARLLLATTLRRLGQIDDAIRHCLARPLPRAGLLAQHILRLGVAQLLFLGTAPHAAVSASVDQAERAQLTAHKKLINAVLRRLSLEGAALRDAQDAARLNTPKWLWTSWSAAYGEDTARAIASQHLTEPPLDISLKPGSRLRAMGRAAGGHGAAQRQPAPAGARRRHDHRAVRLRGGPLVDPGCRRQPAGARADVRLGRRAAAAA